MSRYIHARRRALEAFNLDSSLATATGAPHLPTSATLCSKYLGTGYYTITRRNVQRPPRTVYANACHNLHSRSSLGTTDTSISSDVRATREEHYRAETVLQHPRAVARVLLGTCERVVEVEPGRPLAAWTLGFVCRLRQATDFAACSRNMAAGGGSGAGDTE